MDWEQDWAALEANDNPFALVVMAHLKVQAVKEGEDRKQWKLYLAYPLSISHDLTDESR